MIQLEYNGVGPITAQVVDEVSPYIYAHRDLCEIIYIAHTFSVLRAAGVSSICRTIYSSSLVIPRLMGKSTGPGGSSDLSRIKTDRFLLSIY